MHAFADKNADYFVADPEVVEKALAEAPTDFGPLHTGIPSSLYSSKKRRWKE